MLANGGGDIGLSVVALITEALWVFSSLVGPKKCVFFKLKYHLSI